MTRACPICGHAGPAAPAFPYATRWNEKVFSYVSCGACGTTYIVPLPDDGDFALMYSTKNYHDIFYGDACTGSRAHSLEVVARFRPAGGALLDYGCGNGSFLTAAKAAGYSCLGLEYAEDSVRRAAENSGVPVLDPRRLDSNGQAFDVIHLGDVLEHLPDPLATMRGLSRRLVPGGLFLVEGPLETNPSVVRWVAVSVKRARRRFPGGKQPGAHSPTHLFMTNARAQHAFFTSRLGFRCLHFETSETGWPYLEAGRSTLGMGAVVKVSIGAAAVALSKVFGSLGNRFVGVFQP